MVVGGGGGGWWWLVVVVLLLLVFACVVVVSVVVLPVVCLGLAPSLVFKAYMFFHVFLSVQGLHVPWLFSFLKYSSQSTTPQKASIETHYTWVFNTLDF